MSTAVEIIATALLAVGSLFVLLGAVGVVRMPDLYTRLQTTSKSITLGAACILLAAAILFADEGAVLRTLMIIAFLFMTTPIAAHVLSRVSYISGIPVASETRVDELAGRYTPQGELRSTDAATADAQQQPEQPR